MIKADMLRLHVNMQYANLKLILKMNLMSLRDLITPLIVILIKSQKYHPFLIL